MSSMLNDVRATDAALDLIAGREAAAWDDRIRDDVLASMAALALAVDEPPVPESAVPMPRGLCAPVAVGSHRGGLALTATVVLVLSSSGMAAAMTGDALAPLHYVTRHVLQFGPHGSGQLPGWDLDGAGPVSSRVTHIGTALVQHRIGRSLWAPARHGGDNRPAEVRLVFERGPGGGLHRRASVVGHGPEVVGDAPSGAREWHQSPRLPRRPAGIGSGRTSPPLSATSPVRNHGVTGQTTRPPVGGWMRGPKLPAPPLHTGTRVGPSPTTSAPTGASPSTQPPDASLTASPSAASSR